MSRIMSYLNVILGLFGAAFVIVSAQQQCFQVIQGVLERCAQQANTNFQTMQFISSNGRQGGPLPPGTNFTALKENTCRMINQLTQCSYNGVQSPQLPCDPREKDGALNYVNDVFSSLETACGQAPGIPGLPAPNPCMQNLTRHIRTCYSQLGLIHDDMSNNRSTASNAVIGGSRESANQFCGVHERLAICIDKAVSGCPNAQEILAASGTDHVSMARGIRLLCENMDTYLDGLQCFSMVPVGIEQCLQEMGHSLNILNSRGIRQQIRNKQDYFNELCRIRTKHIYCDITKWTQCAPSIKVLKTQFECAILPRDCYKDPMAKREIEESCMRAQQVAAGSSIDAGRTYLTVAVFAIASLLHWKLA